MVNATLVGRGWAVPGAMPQDALWKDFFSRHYDDSTLAARIFAKSGVERRHGVVDPRQEDVSGWSTGARMRRFVEEAMPLGKEALTACMADAGLGPDDIDAVTVVSCTGYATPGLDILLARDLGLPVDVQRLHVGHMGCYAALPALASVADAAAARGKTGLMLCLELTSLHIQPAADDAEQMVAHALFSDAAAAVAVTPDRPGLQIVDVIARTDAARSGLMTWDVTDLGFRMGLSPQVPDVLGEHVVAVTDELLGRNGIGRSDVDAWAIHPGGPRIVDVVAQRLALPDEQVASSRDVLRSYGNCSSATVLLILDRIMAETPVAAGRHVVAMAFGPGLTLYAVLLRAA
jgi:predicted naringenin-chalcone synthase